VESGTRRRLLGAIVGTLIGGIRAAETGHSRIFLVVDLPAYIAQWSGRPDQSVRYQPR
jgi:hypothetical protein